MTDRKELWKKWKEDYDFKTVTGAFGSLPVTLLFAFYNGCLGLAKSSLWHGTICIYYIMLVFLRASVILSERRLSQKAGGEYLKNKRCITISFMMLLLNLCLIIPITLMVRLQKPVDMTLVPAITMAAYTTYKIAMASVKLKRRARNSNNLVKLLHVIAFIDALVSILVLQNTLIMVNSDGKDENMRTLSAWTGGAIFLLILFLSIAVLIKNIMKRRNTMKVAITYENGEVFQHFGRTPQFNTGYHRS